jgi:subtilisin family serine protease
MKRTLFALLLAANLVAAALIAFQTQTRNPAGSARLPFNADAVRVVRPPMPTPAPAPTPAAASKTCFALSGIPAGDALRERLQDALPGVRLHAAQEDHTRFALVTNPFPSAVQRTARLAEFKAAGHADAALDASGAILLGVYDDEAVARAAEAARRGKAIATHVEIRRGKRDVLSVEITEAKQREALQAIAVELGGATRATSCP